MTIISIVVSIAAAATITHAAWSKWCRTSHTVDRILGEETHPAAPIHECRDVTG